MTLFFLVLAVGGAALLVLGLVAGEFIDGLFDAFDLDGNGVLSLPVIGSFLSAAGVGGLVAGAATDGSLPASLAGAAIGGVALGYAALRLSLAFIDMPTDATLTSGDFKGQIARVVTPIEGGRGEVLLRIAGAPQKLTARSDDDLAIGDQVVVIEVLSASSVRVVPLTEILEDPAP